MPRGLRIREGNEGLAWVPQNKMGGGILAKCKIKKNLTMVLIVELS